MSQKFKSITYLESFFFFLKTSSAFYMGRVILCSVSVNYSFNNIFETEMSNQNSELDKLSGHKKCTSIKWLY